MGKFKLVKKIDLDSFGDDWKGCYLSFYAPGYEEITKIKALDTTDEKSEKFMSDYLKRSFIEGKAFDGKEVVDVVNTELEELPMEILNSVVEKLMGAPSPN